MNISKIWNGDLIEEKINMISRQSLKNLDDYLIHGYMVGINFNNF